MQEPHWPPHLVKGAAHAVPSARPISAPAHANGLPDARSVASRLAVSARPETPPPRLLPVVLTPAEVRAVPERLDGTPRLVVSLLYAAGLRLLEAFALRVKDLDLGAGEIALVTASPSDATSSATARARIVCRPWLRLLRQPAA
jgi:integrase